MIKSIFITLIILIQITQNQQVSYLQSKDRTLSVENYCGEINRQLFTDQQKSKYLSLKDFQNNYFGNSGQMFYDVDKKDTKTIVFFVPWGIGFLITLVIWPFLLCCCGCNCCKCCCTRNDKEYQKFELIWPTIVLVVLSTIIVGFSIYGLISTQSLQKGYKRFRCSGAILFDNILNGQQTADKKSYFGGVSPILNQLNVLKANINQINSQMLKINPSNPNITTLQTKIINSKKKVSQIPNVDTSSLSLSYSSPFNTAPSSNLISSNFSSFLGSISESTTLVGSQYSQLLAIQLLVNSSSQSSNQFTLNMGITKNKINQSIFSLTSQQNRISNSNNDFQNRINDVSLYVRNIKIGFYSYFSAMIAFSIIIITLALVIYCAQKVGLRYFLYFICFILFFVTLFTFILAGIFAFTTVAIHNSCNYADYSYSFRPAFVDFYSNFYIGSVTASKLFDCLPQQSGKYIQTIIGSEITNQLNYLATANKNIKQLVKPNNLTSNMVNIGNRIGQVINSVTFDFNDQNNLDVLRKLSKPSQYDCNTNGFSSDSFVPSNSQNPLIINCSVSAGNAQCSSIANFELRRNGCLGCIDSASISNLFVGKSVSQIQTSFRNRYFGSSCLPFAQQAANVFTNYYIKKYNTLTSVKNRYQTGKSAVIDLSNQLNTQTIPILNTIINNFKNNNLSALVDDEYGLSNALNCRVVGQDLQNATNTLCINTLPLSFGLILIFGSISFALLLSLCCILCVGSRHLSQYNYEIKRTQQNIPANPLVPGVNPPNLDKSNIVVNNTIVIGPNNSISNPVNPQAPMQSMLRLNQQPQPKDNNPYYLEK